MFVVVCSHEDGVETVHGPLPSREMAMVEAKGLAQELANYLNLGQSVEKFADSYSVGQTVYDVQELVAPKKREA